MPGHSLTSGSCRSAKPAKGISSVMVPKLLLTVPEAAKAMSLSRSKLYELIAARKVRSVKVDGARRIPTDALTEYINALLNEEAA